MGEHDPMVVFSEGGELIVPSPRGGLASDEDELSGVPFSRLLVVIPGDSITENVIWVVYT